MINDNRVSLTCTVAQVAFSKIVSEYDLEITQSQLQTNPRHREEEPHNNQERPGRQSKSTRSLTHQDDCKTVLLPRPPSNGP